MIGNVVVKQVVQVEVHQVSGWVKVCELLVSISIALASRSCVQSLCES
jgi:hypothetical protein